MVKTSCGVFLSDYEIIKIIDQGSPGEIFLVEHRFLKKKYILKVLCHDLEEDFGFVEKFKQKISILTTLDHPHILKLHTASENQGTYFLVFDCPLEDGEEIFTLAEYQEPLSEEEIARLASKLASILDFAHAKSYSHGALNLSNILIKKERADLTVYLSDFGLNPVLPDIYSFGSIIYYLLTQKFPEGLFAPLSQLAPHYKLKWDQLLKACLQQDPAQRPHSLTQLMKEISPGASHLKPILKPSEILKPQFDADPGAIFQMETTVGKYTIKPQEQKEVEPILTEMVVVQGGSFSRGSLSGGRDEIPKHIITLSSFAIDIHPVTNEQFVKFLEAMGGEKDHNNNDIIRLRDSRIKRSGGRLTIESGYAKHPVVGVAWYGAVAYAKWVGKRLPTEAEWEISASSCCEENIYPTGKTIERSQANFFSSDTTAVMSYPPNALGLYDMAGNVYEWCQDWYDYHYYNISQQEPCNPKGPVQGVYRVLRGGCWKSLKEDLRSSHRHRNNPGTMNGTYGFRCVADVCS